jgi:acyl-CoA synthetase (AMP-forming)/AMP-acid ligase II
MTIEEIRQARRAGWRASGAHEGKPLFDVFTESVARRGDDLQVFIGENDRRDYSFRELYEQALAVARGFAARGIGAGDTVAVHLANSPEAITAYIAACAVGATLVPIPSIYSAREAGFILKDSNARLLVTADRWRSQEYLAAVPGYQAAGPLEHVVVVGASAHPYLDYRDLEKTPAGPLPELRRPTLDRPAAIIYTSGSTSNPKGVVHSDDTLGYEIRQNYPRHRMTGSTWMNAAPAGHMSGFLAALKFLVFGRPGVWLERWSAPAALALMREHRVTAATLVPFHLMTLIEAMDADRSTFLDLRDVLCGSTTVPTSLIERADALGIKAYRSYGSTEHPTISKSEPGGTLATRSRTDGPVLPDLTVRIVDENGDDVPEGEDGEVITAGPDQCLRYTSPADNEASFTDDGFFRTGDLGHLEDGVLTITGRKKEIIIRGGENISVREIEEVLLEHPDIRAAAVVPRQHDRYGEQVWAFLETVGNKQLSLEDVQRHFREQGVARQKTPEGVVVVEVFPRTAAGKISKRDLQAYERTVGANDHHHH